MLKGHPQFDQVDGQSGVVKSPSRKRKATESSSSSPSSARPRAAADRPYKVLHPAVKLICVAQRSITKLATVTAPVNTLQHAQPPPRSGPDVSEDGKIINAHTINTQNLNIGGISFEEVIEKVIKEKIQSMALDTT